MNLYFSQILELREMPYVVAMDTQSTISRVMNVQSTSSNGLKHMYETRVRLEVPLAQFFVYLSCFELVFSLVIFSVKTHVNSCRTTKTMLCLTEDRTPDVLISKHMFSTELVHL